ncbi:MAG: hypothetical protein EOO14_02525 [Chitinophagaceae bacterium]|nr:MAG: hypothetical protein EOO14_02525 [Chitinophagaceae bacterium]
MALITTIAEIKAVLPRLVSNLSDASQLPNFGRAEEKYLVPITGRALYNDYKTKYAAQSFSADEKSVHQHMQLVICAYAFLDELAFSHSKLTDQGVRTMNTAAMPKAVGWEYKELKQSLQATASDAVEVLLQSLVALNSNLWTASDEYKAFNALLIKTGTEFSQFIPLNKPLQTFWFIRSVVSDVQDNYIRTTIGPDLLDYLKDITGGSESEAYIIKLLKKSIANYTIRHACEKYSAQFSPAGFTVATTDSSSVEDSGKATGVQLLDVTMKAHERDGKSYLLHAQEELHKWYNNEDATADFMAAYAAGPMAGYKVASERDRGNKGRKFFRL